jgi:chemotaxis protein CheD
MNHFVLPQGSPATDKTGRYGNVAIPKLIDELIKHGASRENLRAKLFGGAAVNTSSPSLPSHVGTRNLELAVKLLAQEGIPVISGDTGGNRGRKVLFYTDDGSAWVWLL